MLNRLRNRLCKLCNSHLLVRSVLVCAFATMPFFSAAAAGAAEQKDKLTIGVIPNVSARVIIANYQPMREYFQRELIRNLLAAPALQNAQNTQNAPIEQTVAPAVDIATASDFRAFHDATMKGNYKLIITAANLGRVAQVDGKWEPIAIYEPSIPALLISAAANTNASPEQLRGKSLAVANPQSLVALRGLQWLADQGLQEGRDFKLARAGNEESLAALIRTGEAPLALMSMGEFKTITEATRKNLKIAVEFARVPGFLVMVNPHCSAAEKEQFKKLILQFMASEEGKRFSATTGVNAIRDVKANELLALDAFLPATRAGLASLPSPLLLSTPAK